MADHGPFYRRSEAMPQVLNGDPRAVRANQTLWSRLAGKHTIHEWCP